MGKTLLQRIQAYPRETQEMVFDAHNRAFAFFKGTCTRGIYVIHLHYLPIEPS
jgi:hypothetical protein